MVIERTPPESVEAVGDRFRERGRMLPDAVSYEGSWLNEDGSVCYQLMAAENRAQLDVWIGRWSDLVRFEVVSVETSTDFWERRKGRGRG